MTKKEILVASILQELAKSGCKIIKPHPGGGWVYLDDEELKSRLHDALDFVGV